jgi:hypothetical protein
VREEDFYPISSQEHGFSSGHTQLPHSICVYSMSTTFISGAKYSFFSSIFFSFACFRKNSHLYNNNAKKWNRQPEMPFLPQKNNPGHKTGGLTFPKNPKNLANFAN